MIDKLDKLRVIAEREAEDAGTQFDARFWGRMAEGLHSTVTSFYTYDRFGLTAPSDDDA